MEGIAGKPVRILRYNARRKWRLCYVILEMMTRRCWMGRQTMYRKIGWCRFVSMRVPDIHKSASCSSWSSLRRIARRSWGRAWLDKHLRKSLSGLNRVWTSDKLGLSVFWAFTKSICTINQVRSGQVRYWSLTSLNITQMISDNKPGPSGLPLCLFVGVTRVIGVLRNTPSFVSCFMYRAITVIMIAGCCSLYDRRPLSNILSPDEGKGSRVVPFYFLLLFLKPPPR